MILKAVIEIEGICMSDGKWHNGKKEYICKEEGSMKICDIGCFWKSGAWS